MVIDIRQADGFKIVLPPVGQKYLRQVGPMIPASWYITAEREAQLQLIGNVLPEPIPGYMLLDTGATHVGIDDTVAQELGLRPLAKTSDVHGFGGAGQIKHYTARLILPVIPMKQGRQLSEPVSLGMPIPDVWESKDIRANHKEYGFTTPQGTSLAVIGIIGRIILQFTQLTYNGLTGEIELYIDRSIMFPKSD